MAEAKPRSERAGRPVFRVVREILDENGIFNPVDAEGTVEGAFQVNLHADGNGYRELSEFFGRLAEVDVGTDPNYHEHHTFLSGDGRTRIHLVCRKDDERWRRALSK